MPFQLAASNTLTPAGTLTRFSFGKKTRSTRAPTVVPAPATSADVIAASLASGGQRGLAAGDQLLGLAHRRRGVRRVPVGTDDVGVLLGDRRAADHHEH